MHCSGNKKEWDLAKETSGTITVHSSVVVVPLWPDHTCTIAFSSTTYGKVPIKRVLGWEKEWVKDEKQLKGPYYFTQPNRIYRNGWAHIRQI